MKATLLLRKDHENLQSMLQQFKSGSRKDTDAQFGEIRRAIEMHSRIEQELFYPELENSSLPEAVEAGRRAAAEQASIDDLLKELGNIGPHQKQFAARMQTLIGTIEAHFAFEENELFEEARKVLSEYRQEELGLEMEDRRRFLQLSAA